MIQKLGFENLFKTKTPKYRHGRSQTVKKPFIQKLKDGDKESIVLATVGSVAFATFMAVELIQKLNPNVIINSVKKIEEKKSSSLNYIQKALEDFSTEKMIDGKLVKKSLFNIIDDTLKDAKLAEKESLDMLKDLHIYTTKTKNIRFSRNTFDDKILVELLDEDKLVGSLMGLDRDKIASGDLGLRLEKQASNNERIRVRFKDSFPRCLDEGENLEDYITELIVDKINGKEKSFINSRYVYKPSGIEGKGLVISEYLKNMTLLANLKAANAIVEYAPDGMSAKVTRFAEIDNEYKLHKKPIRFIKNAKGAWEKIGK